MKIKALVAASVAAFVFTACSEETVVEDTPEMVSPPVTQPAPAPMEAPAPVPPLNDPAAPADPSLPPAETPATPPMPPTADPAAPPPG